MFNHPNLRPTKLGPIFCIFLFLEKDHFIEKKLDTYTTTYLGNQYTLEQKPNKKQNLG